MFSFRSKSSLSRHNSKVSFAAAGSRSAKEDKHREAGELAIAELDEKDATTQEGGDAGLTESEVAQDNSVGRVNSGRVIYKSRSMLPAGVDAGSGAGVGQVADVQWLRRELKKAVEAEEKSKKAMDGLAAALKEVADDRRDVVRKLDAAREELRSVKAENERLRSSLAAAEESLRQATEAGERIKQDADDAAAAWAEKEQGLIGCVKVFEVEIEAVTQENKKLLETQRAARDETSQLRDMLRQSANEATEMKESLEIVRAENAQLKDAVAEKDDALQKMRQDYEALKVSEAAAQNSFREIKDMIDQMFTVDAGWASAGASPLLIGMKSGSDSLPVRKVRSPSMTEEELSFGRATDPAWGAPAGDPKERKKMMFPRFARSMKKSNSK